MNMKKLLTLILALTMVLSLCACGASGGEGEGEGASGLGDGLNVGYARENITPDYSVGIGGYSDQETRRSNGFVDYIYLTCIAATEVENTILMITFDNCASDQGIVEKMRESITAATGIADTNIFVAATHCHSCPSLSDSTDANTKYKTTLMETAGVAAQKALEDRSPATMLAASPKFEGMNFVRHYKLSNGTYAGSNFGDFSSGTPVEHATETDPNAVLIKFDRADESKKDILMVNWQGHPDSARDIGYNSLAASWIGPLRTELEKLSGMDVAYFTGASGNQNISSQIDSEKHGLDWKAYGTKMGELINGQLGTLQPVEGTTIKTTRVVFPAEIDHSWDHMLDQANEVYDLWKSQGKAAGDALGKTYDFTSSYQARAIRSRANMSATRDLELNAFSIGDIGFTTGTYEMFSDAGLYVKRNSPFTFTFVITGNSGYIPSAAAYDYRSYESDTGFYAKGTAEKLAEKYVEMLNGLK